MLPLSAMSVRYTHLQVVVLTPPSTTPYTFSEQGVLGQEEEESRCFSEVSVLCAEPSMRTATL